MFTDLYSIGSNASIMSFVVSVWVDSVKSYIADEWYRK